MKSLFISRQKINSIPDGIIQQIPEAERESRYRTVICPGSRASVCYSRVFDKPELRVYCTLLHCTVCYFTSKFCFSAWVPRTVVLYRAENELSACLHLLDTSCQLLHATSEIFNLIYLPYCDMEVSQVCAPSREQVPCCFLPGEPICLLCLDYVTVLQSKL